MVAKHLHNTPTASHQIQAHVLYHWMSFVNEMPVIEANGPNWSTLFYSGSTGVINSSTPQAFYDTNPVFDATFVGKHLAIRDSSNPSNCFIAEITAFISPTRVNLDSTAILNIDSTDVEYAVFDTASPPNNGDFFVVQNASTTGPTWQVRIIVNAAPAALEFEFGFSGGWDIGTTSWLLPVSSSHWLPSSVSRTFCVSDAQVGYVFIWSEDPPGGALADRNALWFGSLVPFHSPSEAGVPKDLDYSAIFGSTTSPGPTDNLSRDTTISDNFVVGEMLNSSGVLTPVYMAQKTLLSSGVDSLSLASATNPRSSQTDDYDAIVFLRSPNQSFRGRVPAVRLLNDVVANRTPLNSNNSYVLGNGIGCVWNGKVPQP